MSKSILYFATGLLLGGVPTYILTKMHYQKYAEEKIGEMLSYLNKEPKTVQYDVEFTKEDATKYKDICANYVEDDLEPIESSKRLISGETTPYLISNEEYGNDPEYDTLSLTYYEPDDVLADDMDDQVSIADNIGYNALKFFGEYEPDTVFVRNDILKLDYEVILCRRSYSEMALGNKNVGEKEYSNND